MHYQKKYGGTIIILKKLELKEELVENPLDDGLDTNNYITENSETELDKKIEEISAEVKQSKDHLRKL